MSRPGGLPWAWRSSFSCLTLKEIHCLKHVRFFDAIILCCYKKLRYILHLLEHHAGIVNLFHWFTGSVQAVNEFTQNLGIQRRTEIVWVQYIKYGSAHFPILTKKNTHKSVLEPVLKLCLACLRLIKSWTLDQNPLHKLLLQFRVVFLIYFHLYFTGQTVGRTWVGHVDPA